MNVPHRKNVERCPGDDSCRLLLLSPSVKDPDTLEGEGGRTQQCRHARGSTRVGLVVSILSHQYHTLLYIRIEARNRNWVSIFRQRVVSGVPQLRLSGIPSGGTKKKRERERPATIHKTDMVVNCVL